jgi:penicillin amidase
MVFLRHVRLLPVGLAFLLLVTTACVRKSSPDLTTESALREESRYRLSQLSGRIGLNGLRKPVTVLRDKWGVPHIYAETVEDLFFAQGFVAAQDRLYQMDIWRRIGRGELSAVFGEAYIERDRIARLTRFRGDMEAEWKSYSPDTRRIAESFTAGINAYIDQQGDRLPIEFTLLDFKPGKWEPEDVLLRTAGLQMTRNASLEIARARLIHALGLKEAMRWLPTDPERIPKLPEGLDLEGLDGRVLATYSKVTGIPTLDNEEGSNNWIVSGKLSATGAPIMASDPHRQIAHPSLRYVTHLVGPGWNVIGGGEPALPGVALGHNEKVGFSFTIAAYDQVDLYVEKVNHGKPTHALYKGNWEPMRIERELLEVRGYKAPISIELKFTRHGPVIWEDPDQDRVVSVRWAGAEPGTAGYLGSLAMSQVQSWDDFLQAVQSWKIPPENIVYGDTAGNIGWLAAGLVPQRQGWEGLLPVPGDSSAYEWTGFLPTEELPQEYNPDRGFIATANHKILPDGYSHDVGFDWSPPYRFERIREVLSKGGPFSMEDFQTLQHDEVSLPGRIWQQTLRSAPVPANRDAVLAREILLNWDTVLSRDSAGAAVYQLFYRDLRRQILEEVVPEVARPILSNTLDYRTIVREFHALPPARRAAMLESALGTAWREANKQLGEDQSKWAWGRLHFALFEHPLANTAERAAVFNLGPVSRGGDAFTVNATSGPTFRQTAGASYRHILDFADWDRSVFTSTPGQSGQPGSDNYGDLLKLWADYKYAPMLYSREKVEANLAHKLVLEPR